MTAAEILRECSRRGIRLRAANGMLRFRPVSAVDAELRAAMLERKAELLAHLQRVEDAGVGPWEPPGGVCAPRQCVRCKGGLPMGEPDGGPCSTCRHYFAAIEPRRVQ